MGVSPAAAAGTVLLNETFTGSSVPDLRAIALGDACLTGAALGSTPPVGGSNLSDCQGHQALSPTPGVTPGWLQLTDNARWRTGGMVFDRALPSRAGLVVTFEQAQYGGNGADGIGFFLSDGSRVLSRTGAAGGSMGYAQNTSTPGVDGGYVGVGLDSWGSFVNDGESRGKGCATPSPVKAQVGNSVAIRGPGDGMLGYCYLTSTSKVPSGPSTLPGKLRNATGPDAAIRTVRITVSPDQYPTITVEIDFDGGGDSFVTVAVYTMPEAVPPTYKFGFVGSTGSFSDVHLVRNVAIESVLPIDGIELTKQVDRTTPQPSSYRYGETIPYQFVVTNAEPDSIDNIVVTDPLVPSITCPSTSLGPAGSFDSSMVCTGTHTVTGPESMAQFLTNSASVTANSPASGVVSDTSQVTVSITESQPRLSMVKSAQLSDGNANGLADIGETIAYSFDVTNTGNVPLTGVGVADPSAGSVTCPATTLAVGESTTCLAGTPRLVTEGDILNGYVTNTATATGSPPPGVTAIDPPTDTVTVPTVPVGGGLSLIKSAALSGADSIADVGETISYSFDLANTGNVTLTGVRVDDPRAGVVTCPVTTLAPGASTTCLADNAYTVTEADLIAGGVVNTATAYGDTPAGVPPITAPTDSVTVVTAVPTAAMSLAKTPTLADTNVNGLADPGETISYGFTLTNLGNVTLTGVGVSDPKVGPVSCAATALVPGASTTCVADVPYTVTESDVLAVGVVNTATGRATPPAGVSFTEPTAQVTTPTAPAASGLAMRKSPTLVDDDANGLADVDELITYSFRLTNTGNLTLSDIAVDDPKVGAVTCPSTTLAPGASIICTADAPYVVTSDDVLAGGVRNVATATGTPPPGGPALTPPVEIVVVPTPIPNEGMSLVKDDIINDVNGNGLADLGETIAYTFTVTNTGNVTLPDIGVSDPRVGSVTCPVADLAVGEQTTCTADSPYLVTEQDIIAGGVVNVATGTAAEIPNVGFLPPTDTITTPTPAAQGGLALTKRAGLSDANGNSLADIGERVDYSFDVSNIGNVTISDIVIDDPRAEGVSCPQGALAPGAAMTCVADNGYVVGEQDIITRAIDNLATAHGTAPAGVPPILPPTSSTHLQTAAAQPVLTLTKSASLDDANGNNLADVGELIAYSFTVTNAGNLTFSGVGVADPKAGAVTCLDTVLAPGATTSCTADSPYRVVEDDVASGAVVNTATAVATLPPGSPDWVAPTDQVTVPTVSGVAGLSLVKSATLRDVNNNAVGDLGESIDFGFELTNTGNVTISNLALADPRAGAVRCPVDAVAPGQTVTCTAASYQVTEADVVSGAVVNTARASGTAPGVVVLDPDSPTLIDSTATPTALPTAVLDVVKNGDLDDMNGNGFIDAGELISYSFSLVNSGNVTLRGVSVDDPKIGPVACPQQDLPPGGSMACSAPLYTVSTRDVALGDALNVAVVTAGVPDGVPPLDPVTVTLALPAPPLDFPPPTLPRTGVAVLGIAVSALVLTALGGWLLGYAHRHGRIRTMPR